MVGGAIPAHNSACLWKRALPKARGLVAAILWFLRPEADLAERDGSRMGRDDWYRNREWSPEIEAQFSAKLKRARDKAQYLRIQACSLKNSHPETALMLLERYFALGDDFDRAQAYVDQADALLALGEIEAALTSYERALTREQEFPNALTQAYLELPFLIATTRRQDKYQRALEVLSQAQSRLMFPVDRFKWHAAHALISEATGADDAARRHARAALENAYAEHSGFRYHASVGLVGSKYPDLRHQLAELAREN